VVGARIVLIRAEADELPFALDCRQRSVMGNIFSSNPKSRLGICLTLDAFGTLYHPKRPIAVQYLEVARRCGLKANIQIPELEASFRKAFKDQSRRYPNYGKSKGMSVETWWDNVVYGAFYPLCNGHEIPVSLGSTLFRHFSSRDAYALYPDVLPFFQMMRKLREKFSDPKGPIILVGVVTNSDNRVRAILTSLGLHVGPEWQPSFDTTTYSGMKNELLADLEDVKSRRREARREGRKFEGSPASGRALNWYKSTDDINYLVTSYAVGHEKPKPEIFAAADMFAVNFPMSRLEQSSPDGFLTKEPFKAVKVIYKGFGLTRIHVGDDFEKDYQGAKDSDRQALHLCRDDKARELKNYQISNLLELATFINLMADTNLSGIATSGK
jgi:FMN phosphatase YigB (HAD superfamily)